jgi:hypothetical protein
MNQAQLDNTVKVFQKASAGLVTPGQVLSGLKQAVGGRAGEVVAAGKGLFGKAVGEAKALPGRVGGALERAVGPPAQREVGKSVSIGESLGSGAGTNIDGINGVGMGHMPQLGEAMPAGDWQRTFLDRIVGGAKNNPGRAAAVGGGLLAGTGGAAYGASKLMGGGGSAPMAAAAPEASGGGGASPQAAGMLSPVQPYLDKARAAMGQAGDFAQANWKPIAGVGGGLLLAKLLHDRLVSKRREKRASEHPLVEGFLKRAVELQLDDHQLQVAVKSAAATNAAFAASWPLAVA